MSLIADILLVAGALGASLYCFILSRRLAKFNDLEQGVGGAVAILSVQVDEMTKTLSQVQVAATASTDTLGKLTVRAEGAARRLELLVASLHDLPEPPDPVGTARRTDATHAASAPNPSARQESAETSDLLFLRHPTPVKKAAQ